MEGNFLAKAALVQIPNAKPDAKQIVGLVKESGRVTGYKLSDQRFVSKSEAVKAKGIILEGFKETRKAKF